MRFGIVTIVLAAAAVGSAQSAEWNVFPDGSGDASTIKEAVELASDGDEILVHPGMHETATVDLLGKALYIHSVGGPDVTLVSLPSEAHAPVLLFQSGETSNTLVEGMTLVGLPNTPPPDGGGAVVVQDSSPLIRDCTFRDFFAVLGGAVLCIGSGAAPEFEHCTFFDNWCVSGGALIVREGAAVRLVDCSLLANAAQYRGGAVAVGEGGTLEMVGCFAASNFMTMTPGSDAAFLFCASGSEAQLTGCTITTSALFEEWGSCILAEGASPGREVLYRVQRWRGGARWYRDNGCL